MVHGDKQDCCHAVNHWRSNEWNECRGDMLVFTVVVNMHACDLLNSTELLFNNIVFTVISILTSGWQALVWLGGRVHQGRAQRNWQARRCQCVHFHWTQVLQINTENKFINWNKLMSTNNPIQPLCITFNLTCVSALVTRIVLSWRIDSHFMPPRCKTSQYRGNFMLLSASV